MKHYIGCKLIEAEPALRINGEVVQPEGDYIDIPPEATLEEGYRVRYPDGYESWSPKEVFEQAYFEVRENKTLPSGVSIGEEMVDEFICSIETFTIPPCTTLVHCTLRNGFTITESSACVDPKNYDEKVGEELCMKKIKSKIWNHLGFLLQTAWHGIL